MVRRIIKIDEDKCIGCGACADACHEGAIGMVNGKARLMRENYCDGLGDCLPACPTDAITFEEREAPAYDEAAVAAAKQKSAQHPVMGCPGAQPRQIDRKEADAGSTDIPSQLHQWPCQIKLVPVAAPYFDGADLLIAADCTAFAYANVHADYMRGKVTLIGCPKLDGVDYSEKLTEILTYNGIKSITLLRMEVPCCGGLEMAAKRALQNSGKSISMKVVTISVSGQVLAN